MPGYWGEGSADVPALRNANVTRIQEEGGSLINAHIKIAFRIPSNEAIKRVIRKNEVDMVVFSVMYNPSSPRMGYHGIVKGNSRLPKASESPGGADQSILFIFIFILSSA